MPIVLQQRIDFCAPVFSIKQLCPAHFARDDLVASRIIQICFQQLHVFLGLLVLLLQETLPIVLVPHSFWFALEVGHHLTKRQLAAARKNFCGRDAALRRPDGAARRPYLSCSSRLVCNRNCPQAASMSCPFSRRSVAGIPSARKIDKNFSWRLRDGRDQGRPSTVL